jgi:N-acetylmuramoyl-L-alanine amidase
LFLLLSILSPVSAAAGVATLYKGNAALGQVPVMDRGTDDVAVSVADAGALLGLTPSVMGEELVLSRGNDKLRVVLNAVAAWHNNQLIPLYSSSYVQDGRWWLDSVSLLSLLQRVAGRGSGDRLSVEKTPGGAVASLPQTGQAAANVPASSSVSVHTSRPQSAPAQTSRIQISQSITPSSAEKNSTNGASSAGGELRALRWSVSREKIRAVADCSDGTNPEMKVVSGKVALNFAKAADDLEGLPSPYENVKAELARGKDGSATLLFSASGVKLEKLVLDNPRRIVLDFLFTAPTEIRQAQAPQVRSDPTAAAAAAGRDTVPKKKGKMLVVLDPGHGGNDPGAVGNGVQEKTLNLAVGLKMEKALQAKGFDVKMTRRTDVYLKLQERTDIANEADADIFVSIHVNALPPGKNSAGFEIYLMALPTDKDALNLAKIENREYLEDHSNGAASDRRTDLLLKILGDMQQNNKINESTVLAEHLSREGGKAGLPMKRVAQAPFFVLRGAAMPAVLLEMGFITNAGEAKLLAHPDYQQRIADAMANGVYSYLTQ